MEISKEKIAKQEKKFMNIFSRLSIQSKVMVCLIAISLASILVTSYSIYTTGNEVFTRKIFDQMTQLRTSRSRQIKSYFAYIRNQVITLAASPTVVQAMSEFHQAFNQLEQQEISPEEISQLWKFYQKEFIPNLNINVDGTPSVKTYFPSQSASQYLQYHYLAANPYPSGQKSRLDNPNDGSSYSQVHQRFHPIFRNITKRFQYDNLMLIDAETENVVYIVEKVVGLGSNFIGGPLANSGVEELLEILQKKAEPGSFAVTDFEPFRPYFGQPGAFIASPIFDRSRLIGILVLQFPVEEINRIMTGNYQWEADGLGETGETILVGADRLMRSQSRFLVEDKENYLQELKDQQVSPQIIERIGYYHSPILLQEIDAEPVRRALAGESGTSILPDYRGIPALVSYAPLKLAEDINWAIVAKIYANEAFEPIERLSRQVLGTAALLVPLVTIASLFLSRQLVSPIYRLMAGTRKLATGEKGVIVSVPSQDEFAQLALSFNQMARQLDSDKQALEAQIEENETLLGKVLPAPIVKRLKAGEQRIADQFANVTVLSANLSGFDEGCECIAAGEAIDLLNEMANAFDEAAEHYEVEKISTMGTAYLATVGLFVPRLVRNKSAVDFALEMMRIVRRFSQEHNLTVHIHVGIHSGPLIGGILGTSKVTYTLLGNTARIARLLVIVNGVENNRNNILVSQGVYESVQDFYPFTSQGEIEVPGGNKLPVWSVKLER